MKLVSLVRVAFYLATHDEDTYFVSPDTQQLDLNEHLESRRPDGWVLKEGQIYRDEISADRPDRQAFAQLMGNAMRKRFDLVLIHRLDRLALTATGLLQIIDQLRKLKVSVVSVSDNFDTRRHDHSLTLSNLRMIMEAEGTSLRATARAS